MIPFDLLARHPFRLSVIASVCCFTGQSAGLVALPFYLQGDLLQGPLVAGLVVTCWPLAVAIASLFGNRMMRGFGTAAQCAAGGAILGTGLLLSAVVPTHGSIGPVAIGAMLCGLGFGLFQVANNRVMFLTASPERTAAAGGMQGTARLGGQTLGTLMMSLIFTWAIDTSAPRIGFAFGALFAAAAALVSVWRARVAGDGMACNSARRSA